MAKATLSRRAALMGAAAVLAWVRNPTRAILARAAPDGATRAHDPGD